MCFLSGVKIIMMAPTHKIMADDNSAKSMHFVICLTQDHQQKQAGKTLCMHKINLALNVNFLHHTFSQKNALHADKQY